MPLNVGLKLALLYTHSGPVQLSFSESVGPQLPAMPSQTPADFFHLFCTNDLLDLLNTD